MTHLDLFSGIGGFALAARWVWGAEHNVAAFCEIDPWCHRVLRKHWPDAPIHNDIRALDGRRFPAIDLLTGGFPCQPYSSAGKRRGAEDDRALWLAVSMRGIEDTECGLLPTLTARDERDGGHPSEARRHTPPLSSLFGGPLSPRWAEWFMGYPDGWTDCGTTEPSESEPSAMRSSRRWRRRFSRRYRGLTSKREENEPRE